VSKRITAQASREGVTALIQIPVRPDGASAHDLTDIVEACATLLWLAISDEDFEDDLIVGGEEEVAAVRDERED
jgi:hypothetical protein